MISALLQQVEARMIVVTSADRDSRNPVYRAVHQHLAAGGSRLRARICLHASLQLGLHRCDAVTLAALCELLHNASLVQDDFIDRASPRRGLPSVWVAFDDATAICAGDLMLSAAFALVAALEDTSSLRDILLLTHERSGDVIAGQAAETITSPQSLDQYEVLAKGKSASLLSLPLELPLLLSHQSRHLPLARQVVGGFAVAYQMADDLEDFQQDTQAGSVNAVSVALHAGAESLAAAQDSVRLRAASLLETAQADALDLPHNCAGILQNHARNMQDTFQTLHPV